jgi:protease-4
MRARTFSFLCATLLLSTLAEASEPLPPRAARIDAPGRSVAGEDSAEALVLNPANIGSMVAPEFRWTGVRCPDTKKINCGHAFDLATPLLWGLATGLRVDYVTPPGGPDSIGFPYDGIDYTWITWGLGYRPNERFQIGASLQRSYSTNAVTDGLFGITAGMTYRPYTHFAFSAVAQDFNGPSQAIVPGSRAAIPSTGFAVMDRSYVLAMAFRPTGTRVAELGLELKYLDATDNFIPRATLGIDIPGVGRARGDVEVAHLPNDDRRGIVGSAGLEIYFAGVSAGGGALFGAGLGRPQSVAEYATVSIAGYVSPGVPRRTRAVYLRIENTPGTRGHVHMLRRLWRIAQDREIAAVNLVLRAEPASSFAHAEEMADAIRVLKAHGKKVLCSWENAGAKALYVCASADRIVVNPAGGLNYAGLRTQYFYLAGLLDKLGIKAEFVRISDHKSAPEQFMNEKASDIARADHEDLLRQYEAVFDKNLELYRHIPAAHIHDITASGPFVASEAKQAGFVDGTAFDDELERATQDLVGSKIAYEKYEDETRAPKRFGPAGKVAILYVEGDMVDGRSQKIPLLDMRLVGSYSIAEAIKSLRDNGDVKAVVLRIESPGGSSMAADVMWRELEELAKKKPLIVSMGSTAASGGYYIAAPARTIYALPLTVTGSIGIWYGKADISGLLKKIGVNIETYKTTPRADAESIFRGFTDDERRELDHKIHQFYDVFLERVSVGRHMSKKKVDDVGQGRVWSGQQALDKKLVDKMGGIREALEAARAAAGLPEDSPILEAPAIDQSLLEKALDLVGLRAGATAIDALPVQIKDAARAIAPMAVYSGDTPLARMDWVSFDENDNYDSDPYRDTISGQ